MPPARIWRGDRSLHKLLVPIESVRTRGDNPRRGNVEAVARSLERFGQRSVLVANDATGAIAKGNHTWLAAKMLGWTHVAVLRQTFDDEHEEVGYMVADNRSSDLASYDNDDLIESLTMLADAGRLEGTGYDEDYLNELLAEQQALAEAAKAQFEPAQIPPPRLDQRDPGVVEVVLLMSPSDEREFGGFARALAKEYGTKTVTETVLRAVREAVRDAGQQTLADD